MPSKGHGRMSRGTDDYRGGTMVVEARALGFRVYGVAGRRRQERQGVGQGLCLSKAGKAAHEAPIVIVS